MFPAPESDAVSIIPNLSTPCQGDLLIIDDTPDNLRVLSYLLRAVGYEVRSASSGTAALMAVNALPPDLILLDIRMPEMDGYTVCKILKSDEKYAQIPIIFLSAYNAVTDKIKAFEVGGVDYITKPFQSSEVLARVSLHLSLRRSQRALEASHARIESMLEKEREINRFRSQFVSMISHDFRTPLTTIQGFTSLFKASLGDLTESQQVYFLDKIESSVDHILEMLDQFLLISQAEQGSLTLHLQPLDLRSFCSNLIENFQVTCNQTHQLTFVCQTHSCQAVLDQKLLQTILENLLSNAIKYSPEGGEVRLTLACTADHVCFQVRDWGIGIPLENQNHLFDHFYRAKNTGEIKGTGLGLAIVKQCIDAQGGRIEVESREGEGTTFTFYLPYVLTNLSF